MADFHGLQFDERVPEAFRHLVCWQRHREEPYRSAKLLNPPHLHFLEACRLLFTERQLVIHPWFEAVAKAYTENQNLILLGAASTGKSHAIGLLVLLDYLTDPENLYASLVSTSKEALLLRSMASCIEYLNCLKQNKYLIPFKFLAQKTAIVPENADEATIASVKAQIRGVALREGSLQDAKGSVIGVHLPRIRSVADELENMGVDRAQAFLDAQSNLAVTPDYKCCILFNPQSVFSPGCRLAEPVGGWGSIDPETASEWTTATGYKVLRFDGHRSPGITEPSKYPFLPNVITIAAEKKRCNGNEDHPNYWTMVRGFPPRQGNERTVLRTVELLAGRCSDKVIWRQGCIRLAALDPAFTSDGDDCALVTGAVGLTVEGAYVLQFDKVFKLVLKASNDVPILKQIVDQVSEILKTENIEIVNFGCDSSGTQNVADAVVMACGAGLYRANFSHKPP